MWSAASTPPAAANDYLVGWWFCCPEQGTPHFVQVVAGYGHEGWLEYADRITHWQPLPPPPRPAFSEPVL